MAYDYTSEQHKLRSQLEDYSPVIKTAYEGAIHVLATKDYPDRLAQFAYSLREVIDLLTRKNQTGGDRRKGLNVQERTQSLADMIDPAEGHTYEFDQLYEKLTHEHQELNKYVHHEQDLKQNDAEEKLKHVEKILLHLTRPQIEIIKEIDQIISSNPSTEMAMQLKPLLIRWSSYSYVLEKLSKDWLTYLDEANFFDIPHLPHPSSKKNSERFPYWMPSGYLVKCVNSTPELVIEIILKCEFKNPKERNPLIYNDFLKCTAWISNDNVEKLAHKAIVEKWHDFCNHFFIVEKYVNLAEKLYVEEKYEIAIKLLSGLFCCKKEDFINLNDLDLQQILTNDIPRFIKKNPTHIAKLLVSTIENVLVSINARQGKYAKAKDSSYYLPSAIEDHAQNGPYPNPLALCITQLRDSLIAIGDADPTQLKKIMNILSEKNFYIFRRIELFLYSKFPTLFKDEISESFEACFDIVKIHHEYYHLLKNTFGKMTESEKNHFLDFIECEKQQRFEKFKEIYKEKSLKKTLEQWLLEKLEPIHEHLNDKYKKQYDELITKFGIPNYPDFMSHVSALIGKSDIDLDMFTNKPIEEIFETLDNHDLTSDSFTPDDKILASFGDYVRKNPLECSKRSMDMVDVDPKKQREFLSNIESSVNVKEEIEWDSVLSLIENILNSAISDASNHQLLDKSILEACRVIEKGLRLKQIDYNLKEDIWRIVRKITEVGNMFPGHKKYNNNVERSLDISINDINGLSFHILCRYMWWCHDHEKSDNVFTKDIKQILESYIKKDSVHTIERHSVLGLFFPTFFNFDEDWTSQTILPKPFSSDFTKIAFWDSYVFNGVQTDIMIKLYKMYGEFLNGGISKSMHGTNLYHKTIEHVTLGYLYNIEKYDEIFKKFLGNAIDDGSINHCGFFIAGILMDNSDAPKFKDKIINLWGNQKFIDHANLHIWFKNNPFDKKDTIESFLNYMTKHTKKFNVREFPLEKLNAYVEDFPQKVGECILIFVDDLAEDSYDIPIILKSILKDLKAKNIDTVEVTRKKIIEKLVERGHNDYKELL